MEKSKYLEHKEVLKIREWIKKVRKNDYVSKHNGDTKAWKKLKLPYKVLGCGFNRIVYDIGNNLVLKVAVTTRGIRNNEREAYIYEFAPPPLKEHLAKVKEYGNGWIIMKSFENKPVSAFSVYYMVKKLIKEFEEAGIEAGDLIFRKGGLHRNNIRLKKGRVIVIDYGDFKLIKS